MSWLITILYELVPFYIDPMVVFLKDEVPPVGIYCEEISISHLYLKNMQPYNYKKQQNERIRKEWTTTLLKIPTNKGLYTKCTQIYLHL